MDCSLRGERTKVWEIRLPWRAGATPADFIPRHRSRLGPPPELRARGSRFRQVGTWRDARPRQDEVVAVPAPLIIFAHRWRVPGLVLALVALVAGVRWATIDRFGSDLPNADQWDAEAVETLLPWFERDHFVSHLLQPHNEHRVVLTKLQALAEALLVGQWDARVQTVANAGLAALFLGALWLAARCWTNRSGELALLLATVVLFGLPLAWENILGGFHSQQWWLIGLSTIAITQWPYASPWTARWLVGAGAAILALGAMGSGFFAAAVVAGAVADRWRRGEIQAREAAPTFLIAVSVAVTGLALRVDFAPHEALKAKSVGEFATHFLRSLQWPWRGQIWIGVLLWLPWLIVLLKTWPRRPHPAPSGGPTIVALGTWVGLQLIATSYVRGAGADYPAPRYVDTLAFGLLINACALAWLLARPAALAMSPRGRTRLGLVLLTGVWSLTLIIGLGVATPRVLAAELPAARTFIRAAEGHVRGYLASNDPRELASDDLPFPSPEGLVWRLGRPALRDLMPVSVRAALPLRSADASSKAFQPNLVSLRELPGGTRQGLSSATPPYGEHPTWGSHGANGPADKGLWMSAPLATDLQGWLKFETAGQLGEPGLALELHDAQTGVLLASVRPSRTPGDGWRAAYVAAPARPFVVVARDEDATRWFAFSAPVEMSSGSRAAQLLAKNGLLIALVGAFIGLLPAAVLRFGARPPAASRNAWIPKSTS